MHEREKVQHEEEDILFIFQWLAKNLQQLFQKYAHIHI